MAASCQRQKPKFRAGLEKERKLRKKIRWGAETGQRAVLLWWMTWNPKDSQTINQFVSVQMTCFNSFEELHLISFISSLLYWVSRRKVGGKLHLGIEVGYFHDFLFPFFLPLRHFSDQFQFWWIGISQWVKKNKQKPKWLRGSIAKELQFHKSALGGSLRQKQWKCP